MRLKTNLHYLVNFCNLYVAHRDFTLAKRIAKNNPLSYEQAEKMASFFNQLVVTKECNPTDLLHTENDATNAAIDKYLILKKCLQDIKTNYGVPYRNKLHKAVKLFYRKHIFCYEMDSYFTFVINGYFLYVNNLISLEKFKENYYFEVSLFTGKKKPLNLKKVIRIARYILGL